MYTHHVFIRAIYKVHYVAIPTEISLLVDRLCYADRRYCGMSSPGIATRDSPLARILQAAIGEGLDTNCVVLPPSILRKMTEAQANTEL